MRLLKDVPPLKRLVDGEQLKKRHHVRVYPDLMGKFQETENKFPIEKTVLPYFSKTCPDRSRRASMKSKKGCFIKKWHFLPKFEAFLCLKCSLPSATATKLANCAPG